MKSAPPRDPLLRAAALAAARRGIRVYLVGGCVRDRLLGRPLKDLDLAVEGPVEPLARELSRRLKAKLTLFDRFGTARLEAAAGRLDLARTRTERYPEPAALPVVSPAPLEADLGRRDFTVNAMALGPLPEAGLVDPHGGRRDLALRRLRILHPESFRDDPTRIFRAARFAGRFGFSLDPGTRRALDRAKADGRLRRLSPKRAADELLRILAERDPGPALALLAEWGVPAAAGLPALGGGPLRGRDPWLRLGELAARSSDGAALLAALDLPRERRAALDAAVKSAKEAASPRGPLPPGAREALRAAFPDLPPAALKPLLADGKDLERLGLEPGPAYRGLLDSLARAQWRGTVRTRAQALAWLKKSLGRCC